MKIRFAVHVEVGSHVLDLLEHLAARAEPESHPPAAPQSTSLIKILERKTGLEED